MGFLAPLFLFGALAAAVPLVLHLSRRPRAEIAFPSVLFLRRLGTRIRKRRRLRDLPLLVLRCLAVAMLALTFARPFLPGGDAPSAGEGPRDVAILVDRSLSMTAPGRAALATEAALAEVEGLAGGDRGVVIAFDDRPEALTGLTDDRDALAAAVGTIEPGSLATRFAPALGLAARLLPEVEGRSREVVLVSDLQRNGFEDGRPESVLPPGVALRVASSAGDAVANAWVASVELVPESDRRTTATAELRFAPTPAVPERSVAVELRLAGRAASRREARLTGARSVTVRFEPFTTPREPLDAEVVIEPDAMPADDAFRFVVNPGTAIRVADLAGGRDPGSDVYVREGLAVGRAPAFEVTQGGGPGAGTRTALASAHVALVRNPASLDRDGAGAVREFVEAGGGAVFSAGERAISPEAAAALGDVLPATFGRLVDRSPGIRLGGLDGRHPVFEGFATTGGFGTVPFHRYRELTDFRPGAEVLARFDDGSAALVESVSGDGRVLVFASSLDASWNDLPRQGAFVPFLIRLIGRAAGFEPPPPAFRAGSAVLPVAAFRPGPGVDPEPGIPVEPPGGGRFVAPADRALRLDRAGFWSARFPGVEGAFRIAVNPPAAESDLAALDPEDVRLGAAAISEPDAGNPDSGPESRPAAIGPPRTPWRLPLLALVLLLVAETALGNRRGAALRSTPNLYTDRAA